jgi:hypothetical protein
MSLPSSLRLGTLVMVLMLGFALLRVAGSLTLGALQAARVTFDRARHEALVARPPRPLTVRAEDYRRFPRAAFGLIYEDSNGNRLDTFAGTYTKDLIGHPDTTVAMVLPPADLDSIYEVMIRIRFFDPTELFPSLRVGSTIQPNTTHRLRARAGSIERELVWDTGTWVDGPTTDDGKRLLGALRLIWRRIKAHPVYQKLPKAFGGYF